MEQIFSRIAHELDTSLQQVSAAVSLLDEGATVPFIARYRKEVTGGLDDSQLRLLDERLRYLRELEDRRETILSSIKEQEKLTPELEAAIKEADTKTRLEDLYLPYKPKRRTKAQVAREAGLEPLADALFDDPTLDPTQHAEGFLNPDQGVDTIKAALDGAKQILMERFSEDAELLGRVREFQKSEGVLTVLMVEGKEQEGAKFRDYFDHKEPLKDVPSHRALAIFRGRNEGVLQFSITMPDSEECVTSHPCEAMIADHWQIKDNGRPADKWLQEVVRWTWRVKLNTHIETELFSQLREQAEEEAIKVFAKNLQDLLLAAPAGPKATLGLDPGLRTGVKVAVVDDTGKVVDHGAIFPHAPQKRWEEAIAKLAELCKKHQIKLISIGNGTASRETDKLAGELISRFPELGLTKIMVNEAGASVYSASEYAAKEFPDLDVTIRGAVSIARRLQDPLAELVKIEPKAIGVGQYQHDVNQTQLARSLDAVVEDCVNSVGVDVNMASAALLTRISGLNAGIAQNVVKFRDENGAFADRDTLKKVPRLGAKAFEQAAGFLRVVNGSNPLDASSVHPESYDVVAKILEEEKREVSSVMGDTDFLRQVSIENYVTDQVGLPTLKDILQELEKPGRDPRPEFKTANFKEGVETLKDLKENMILEGVVTNVTNFGAFVDIGVHQDGLVHISALSNKFVKSPHDVVSAGDIVKVKVIEVDIARKRIALTMRLEDSAEKKSAETNNNRSQARPHSKNNRRQKEKAAAATGTFAQLFADAEKRKGKRL